jgi:hypothetical protein
VSRIARYSLLLLAIVALGACYQVPEEQMAQQQLMQDMSDVVNQMGLQVAEMQGTLDSLKGLVAKQDTAIYRMANVTGVPYAR